MLGRVEIERIFGGKDAQTPYVRRLYAAGSSTFFMVGTGPRLLMYNDNTSESAKFVKLGEFVVGIRKKGGRLIWLYECKGTKTTHRPGIISYNLSDGSLPGVRITLRFVPLSMSGGCVVFVKIKQTKSVPLELLWCFWGLSCAKVYYCPYNEGWSPRPEDTRDNVAWFSDGIFRLENTRIAHIAVAGGCDYGGEFSVLEVPLGKKNGKGVLHRCRIEGGKNGTFRGHIILNWRKVFDWLSYRSYTPETRVRELLKRVDDVYKTSVEYFEKTAKQLLLCTPYAKLNSVMGHVNVNADGCWRPPAFIHSTQAFTEWYAGWRSYYGPSAAGWHERVESALKFHGRNRAGLDGYLGVDDADNYFIDPSKKAPDGRIHMSIEPIEGAAGGHHDIVQLYIDHMYYDYCWTGNRKLVKDLWMILKDAMKWQKAARDPDDDGLYVNVLNTWISDGHEYHEGACTQQTAYVYKNNLVMAEWAKLMGEDPLLYLKDARKIKKAMNNRLWLSREGVFAEYEDAIGIVHPHPAAASIYHPIEMGVTDMFQSYQMLDFAKRELLLDSGLILGNRWYPPGRMFCEAYVNETLNTAVAFYEISDREYGYKVLKAVVDHLYEQTYFKGGKNIYDIYFLDILSLFQLALVKGLFGIRPFAQKGQVVITPNFPDSWEKAELTSPDIEYRYSKDKSQLRLSVRTPAKMKKVFRVPVRGLSIKKVEVNGKKAAYRFETGIRQAFVVVQTPASDKWDEIRIGYVKAPVRISYKKRVERNSTLSIDCAKCQAVSVKDPQRVLSGVRIKGNGVCAQIKADAGRRHIFFVKVRQGRMFFYEPVHIELSVKSATSRKRPETGPGAAVQMIPLDRHYNDKLVNLSKRVPPEIHYAYWFGIKRGWKINDETLRMGRDKGVFTSGMGVPFLLGTDRSVRALFLGSKPKEGLFRQGYLRQRFGEEFYSIKYPHRAMIPINEKGVEKAYVMFAGSTSQMQCYVPNMRVAFHYDKGKGYVEDLVSPGSFDTLWHHYSGNYKQVINNEPPERWYDLSSDQSYRGSVRLAEDTPRQQHVDIIEFSLDPGKTLKEIEFSVVSLDTTAAILGVTLVCAGNAG